MESDLSLFYLLLLIFYHWLVHICKISQALFYKCKPYVTPFLLSLKYGYGNYGKGYIGLIVTHTIRSNSTSAHTLFNRRSNYSIMILSFIYDKLLTPKAKPLHVVNRSLAEPQNIILIFLEHNLTD